MKRSVCCAVVLILFNTCLMHCARTASDNPGLIGVYYSNPDFRGAKLLAMMTDGEQHWGRDNGFATEWSAEWSGYLIAPLNGRLKVYIETNKIARMVLSADTLSCEQGSEKVIEILTQKGRRVPIALFYAHTPGGEGFLRLSWSWNGREKASIPAAHLVYTAAEQTKWQWLIEPEFDAGQYHIADGENIVVVHDPQYFHGWPANNGVWSWGDEILVGLIRSPYHFDRLHHSIDKNRLTALLARSLDGGRTWSVEDPDHFIRDGGRPQALRRGIDFRHPHLAVRCEHDAFFYSYDRGKTWHGPYPFNGLENMGELTSRTDYLPLGDNSCLFFKSRIDHGVKAGLPDRAFCARTDDGGRSFQFLSWMTETDTIRSVMPSTIRLRQNHLITALRRRYDPSMTDQPRPQKNWIDVYQSLDNGVSWTFLNKVADTDNGTWNGNPPSLVQLNDGRLCVAYGCRAVPIGIRAKLSSDDGKTWGKEIILRADGLSKDMGYTRAVVRPDGRVVTLYYFTTLEHKAQHIAATIWEPGQIPY